MKFYQLKQRFMGRGAHLPKYPSWVKPTAEAVKAHLDPYKPIYMGHSDGQSTRPFGLSHIELSLSGPERDGNLSKVLYQFFIGHPMSTSDFAQCRTCLEVVPQGERSKHGKKNGCFKIMTSIMKALPKDECVVCGGWTHNSRWSVPLCGPLCEELWKFEVAQPDLILQGIGGALKCAK